MRQTEELVRRLNTPAPTKSPDDEEMMTDPATQAIEAPACGNGWGPRSTSSAAEGWPHCHPILTPGEELAALYDRLIGEPL